MKRILTVVATFAFCLPGFAQETASKTVQEPAAQQDQRKLYVSDASHIVGTHRPASSEQTPAAMANAADRFLKSLDPDLRKRASHDLNSPERREWTNLPARPNAGGVRMGDLNDDQVRAACDLMAALLSPKGYAKMCNIMLADDQLLREGRPRQGFGTEDFSIVVFGTPSATEPWAFQLDGHHIGVNVSITGEKLSLSPSFIGTQPEAFKIATREFRPLAGETDLAYKLIDSLSDEQKKEAIIRPKRAQLVTGPGADGKIPEARGVSCSTFTDEQKKTLVSLITNWIEIYPAAHAETRMKQFKSEIDTMKFAWNGPTADRSDVSYTIQGPTLIIEFACQQLGGNPLDHLHTMYRDPTDEYAGQLDK